MSPNIKLSDLLERLWTAVVFVVAYVRAFLTPPPKKVGRHHINSHSESKYIWTLLGVDSETSQDLIRDRHDRRINGFSSVAMTLGTDR